MVTNLNCVSVAETSSLSEARLTELERRVDTLTRESRQAALLGTRIGGLEDQMHVVSGALAGFLGRIKIDDRLLLVPEARRIEPTSRSSSGGPSPIDPCLLDETDGTGTSSLPISVQHSPLSTSDVVDDIRMEETVPPSPPANPIPLDSAPDTEMDPPPVPILNLIPPPIASQASSSQWVVVGTDSPFPPVPLPSLSSPSEVTTPHGTRGRSRTPLVGFGPASHLLGGEGQGRERSRTPL